MLRHLFFMPAGFFFNARQRAAGQTAGHLDTWTLGFLDGPRPSAQSYAPPPMAGLILPTRHG